MRRLLFLVSFIVFIFACSENEIQITDDGGTLSDATLGLDGSMLDSSTLDSSTADGGRARKWLELSGRERGDYMSDVVVPAMKTLFQNFNAEHFDDFKCSSCHGDNARDVSFVMPNKLAPLSSAEIGELFAKEDPTALFMRDQVVPQMRELLDADPFNPETGEGFGCFSCHAKK